MISAAVILLYVAPKIYSDRKIYFLLIVFVKHEMRNRHRMIQKREHWIFDSLPQSEMTHSGADGSVTMEIPEHLRWDVFDRCKQTGNSNPRNDLRAVISNVDQSVDQVVILVR